MRRHTSAPWINIVLITSGQMTTTEAGGLVPELLARALWPTAPITNGKLMWSSDINEDGADMAVTWLKQSVSHGKYDDLSWMSFNLVVNLNALEAAAKTFGIEKLIEMVNAAKARVDAGTQKDASNLE